MHCPYLAHYIYQAIAPRNPDDGSVCFAHSSGYWKYSGVDTTTQRRLCLHDQ